MKKRIWKLLLAILIVVLSLSGCMSVAVDTEKTDTQEAVLVEEEGTDVPSEDSAKLETETESGIQIQKGESYTTRDEVALYLRTYGELPPNFIRKRDARDLGWDSKEGNLQEVAPGMSIGGDTFGNREGLLPEEKGRKYYECDINYEGGYRGGERIIYSNDGLIYYTADHYKTFTLLEE